MRHTAILLFACTVVVPVLQAQDRLDRDKLLFYADDANKVQPVKTIADWEKRRSAK